MRFLLLACIVISGCAMTSKTASESDYSKIKKIKLGAPSDDVKKILGEPREIKEDSGTHLWTYTVQHKNIWLTRSRIHFDLSNKVDSVFFDLYEEIDGLVTIDDVQNTFSDYRLTEQVLKLNKSHYIPSERIKSDETNGFTAQYLPHQNKKVDWINWYKPEATETKQVRY